jgi:hypothetical protein
MSRQKKRERTRNRETAAGNGPSAQPSSAVPPDTPMTSPEPDAAVAALEATCAQRAATSEPRTATSEPRTANSDQRPATSENPYQAGAHALVAGVVKAVEELEKTGFKLLKAPPGWQPPRQRKRSMSFRRRQIAEVRSGELDIPPGTDRDALAELLEKELEQDLAAQNLIDTVTKAHQEIQAEMEAREARALPGALAVYHEAKALVAADPDHPAASWVKEMDRALRLAQGGREAGRKPGSKPRKGGGRGKGGRKGGGRKGG